MAVFGRVASWVWCIAPSVLDELARLTDREAFEVFVTRAGIWGRNSVSWSLSGLRGHSGAMRFCTYLAGGRMRDGLGRKTR